MAGRCGRVMSQTLGLKLRNNLEQISMVPDSHRKKKEGRVCSVLKFHAEKAALACTSNLYLNALVLILQMGLLMPRVTMFVASWDSVILRPDILGRFCRPRIMKSLLH